MELQPPAQRPEVQPPSSCTLASSTTSLSRRPPGASLRSVRSTRDPRIRRISSRHRLGVDDDEVVVRAATVATLPSAGTAADGLSHSEVDLGDAMHRDASRAVPDQQANRVALALPGRAPCIPLSEANALARLAYAERQQRRRATSLLLLGAIFGGLGFVVAATLGLYHTYSDAYAALKLNVEGRPYPSGKPYWPSSVSEMVNDPATPTGKCWYAFEMIAAIAIWTSWYPWELRNVYVGGGVAICCCLPFLHARTFVPPIGLMLLVMISIASPGKTDFNDNFASYIHLVGAVIMLGGHGLFELFTLTMSELVHMHPLERRLRWFFCVACLGNGACFFIFGQLMGHVPMCCGDVRRVPTNADIASAKALGQMGIAIEDELAQETGDSLLYDTAQGWFLTLKYLEFWCEVMAGFSMVGGLLTIWWFCAERHLDLFDELPGEYSDRELKLEDGAESSDEDSRDSAEST